MALEYCNVYISRSRLAAKSPFHNIIIIHYHSLFTLCIHSLSRPLLSCTFVFL